MGEGARLHVPTQLAVRTSPPIIRIEVRLNGATDAAVQSDLASLPRMLDQVTTWLDEGVLGHQPPNAADYQIATSIRLLLCFDDLHDRIDQSLATYARQVVPHFPGKLTAVFPRSWIARAHER